MQVNAELFLSADAGQPMYRQIVERITAMVAAGDWPPGAPLPSIRELAAANGVSVITVKRAYLELEHAKVIVTQHGKGSFVAQSSDLPRQLLTSELQRHLDATLACATKLGLTVADVRRLLLERHREQDNK